jgi:hypothetical protein
MQFVEFMLKMKLKSVKSRFEMKLPKVLAFFFFESLSIKLKSNANEKPRNPKA